MNKELKATIRSISLYLWIFFIFIITVIIQILLGILWCSIADNNQGNHSFINFCIFIYFSLFIIWSIGIILFKSYRKVRYVLIICFVLLLFLNFCSDFVLGISSSLSFDLDKMAEKAERETNIKKFSLNTPNPEQYWSPNTFILEINNLNYTKLFLQNNQYLHILVLMKEEKTIFYYIWSPGSYKINDKVFKYTRPSRMVIVYKTPEMIKDMSERLTASELQYMKEVLEILKSKKDYLSKKFPGEVLDEIKLLNNIYNEITEIRNEDRKK